MSNRLKEGFILNNQYEILSVLGEGGFGITYLAKDLQLEHKVVIKEFFPQSISRREENTNSIIPYGEGEDNFSHFLLRFSEEAKLLAKLRHPNIVRVISFFELNDTAYFVMEYEEGETLADYLKRYPTLKEEDIIKIVMPILEGTKETHSKGVLHRDIAPDNIFLKKNGMPMLIDFGSARNAIAKESQTLSAIAKDGYSPPEQYTVNKEQTPATDIYALGAVMYRMVTGEKPPNSTQRQTDILEEKKDPVDSSLDKYKSKYSKNFIEAIRKSLNITQSKRFNSIEELQRALFSNSNSTIKEENKKENNFSLTPVFIIGFILIITLGYFLNNKTEEKEIEKNISKEDNKTKILKVIDKNTTKVTKPKTEIEKLEESCNNGNAKDCTKLSLKYVDGVGVKSDGNKAADYIVKGCNLGDSEACFLIGKTLYSEKEYSQAFKFYEKSCNLNNSKGCFELASLYYKGEGVNKSEKKSIELSEKSCYLNNYIGCVAIGIAYEGGFEVKQDKEKALKLYKKACDGGIDDGCTRYKNLLNPKTEIEKLEESCNNGNASDCADLGYKYDIGEGVTENNYKAVELYKKGCDLGSAIGCNNLGVMYEYGYGGVTKDYYKAVELYKKGCDGGNALGCNNLGVMYRKGYGVTKDYYKAVELYKKGCDGSSARGCTNLGFMYENGYGVTKDYYKALELYKKGCDGGNAIGCSNLGDMYEYGKGVTKNKTKALELYKKGCDGGNSWGCDRYKKLSSK